VPFVAAPQDRYFSNIRRLIEQKVAGVEVTMPEAEAEETASEDLMAALKAALKNVTTKKAVASR
jgi:non-homologous end joining protein Ku